MRVTPRSEEEIQTMGLIEPGIYQYQVIDAKDGLSKSGNEMITLQLKVWDNQGKATLLYDYLLDAMPHKIRHFCVTNNMLDKYEAGDISARDCFGKCGMIDVIIQKGKENIAVGGCYPDKNAVKDYLPSDTTNTGKIGDGKNDLNEDIPF